MPTTIINKLGKGSPDPADLAVGEIAQDEETGTLYVKKLSGEVVEVSSDGAGAGMVISATEPADPVDGMQWLESTTAIVWIYDDGKWLEFPSAGISTDVIGEEGETTFQGHFLKLTAKPTRDDDDDDDDLPEGGRIVATGASVLGEVNSLEQIVFGGIVFPGSDAEKPDGMPKAGERSVQPAMRIAHESLGITYQLDKEGVVRANDFADVDGNPLMRVVTQEEYDALTPNAKTVYFII